MPFEEFQSTKTATRQTQNMYKKRLNLLADNGIETREQLKRSHFKTLKTIYTIVPGDDEKARQQRRIFLSAIFWALHGEKMLEKPNLYYHSFQRNKQNYKKPEATEENVEQV